MRSIVTILTAVTCLVITTDASAEGPDSQVDDRDVYIVTSKIAGRYPKFGPMRHASIAICPKGVSPIVIRNGVAVSNCRECRLYGTRVLKRGFIRDVNRVDVTATKVCGIKASTVERRIRSHSQLNVPFLHDCRHQAIQVLGLRNRRGRLKRACTLK